MENLSTEDRDTYVDETDLVGGWSETRSGGRRILSRVSTAEYKRKEVRK